MEHYELSFRRRIATAEKGLRIFISYRRDDTAGYAGWLAERLGNRHRVFIDVDSIGIGADFVREIEESVRSADVVVALIGRQWLDIRKPDGQRRLDDPNDYVRIDIAFALQHNIRVLPVLVRSALMPDPDTLPEELRSIGWRQAVLLNDATFRRDSDLLLSRFTDIATEVEREKRERRHIQRAEQRPAYLRIADDFRFLDQTLRRMVVAHPFVVRTLLGVISLSLIGMLVLFYLYVANARLVDEQLRRGPFSQTTQIYSAPRRLSVGDKLSMNSLIEILNRDAYVDSALNRNGVSTYTRLPLEGVIHITLGPPDPRKRHC